MIGMFRRSRRRSRPRRRIRNSIQHVTAVMGQSPTSGTSVTHFIGNAGTYQLTGTDVQTATATLSNREQEYTIGSHLGTSTINITFRGASASGSYQIVVFKRERQAAVPINGTGLPALARIIAVGMQMAFREEMPGRVLHFQTVGIALNQPRALVLKIPWAKYKLSKMRSGDWYGISIFNQGTTDGEFDIQTRTKELIS